MAHARGRHGRGRARHARRHRGRRRLRRGAPHRPRPGRRLRAAHRHRRARRRDRHLARRLQVLARARRRGAGDGPDPGDPQAPARHAPRDARLVERAAASSSTSSTRYGGADEADLGRAGRGDPARASGTACARSTSTPTRGWPSPARSARSCTEQPEEFDPRVYLKPARAAMQKVIAERMTRVRPGRATPATTSRSRSTRWRERYGRRGGGRPDRARRHRRARSPRSPRRAAPPPPARRSWRSRADDAADRRRRPLGRHAARPAARGGGAATRTRAWPPAAARCWRRRRSWPTSASARRSARPWRRWRWSRATSTRTHAALRRAGRQTRAAAGVARDPAAAGGPRLAASGAGIGEPAREGRHEAHRILTSPSRRRNDCPAPSVVPRATALERRTGYAGGRPTGRPPASFPAPSPLQLGPAWDGAPLGKSRRPAQPPAASRTPGEEDCVRELLGDAAGLPVAGGTSDAGRSRVGSALAKLDRQARPGPRPRSAAASGRAG